MLVRDNDIIFILGAGASADAGIPVISKMQEDVEKFISENHDWKEFHNLYYLIKASYEYSYQIQGKKGNWNLEVLLNILSELSKKEEHPLYPFIGSWNVKFDEVIKDDFILISKFSDKIRAKLVEWVKIDNSKRQLIGYFKRFLALRNELTFPLHIFSLNYDLCVELALKEEFIERGFETEENGNWNYRRFIITDDDADIFLYKLHGSVDWERDEQTKKLTFSNGESSKPDWIFGTQYKMQYIDPYLFLFSEFRKRIFESKIIVSVGYSFYDEHINGVISDTLRDNIDRKLLSISLNLNTEDIEQRLNINNQFNKQIITISDKTAKEFLEQNLTKEFLNQYFDNEEL
jgi:CRISPR/Cas system CSM-associated protein Csm2 small subunit